MASIRFTDHANNQIKERRLSKKAIIKVVNKPYTITKQADGRLKIIGTVALKSKTLLLIVIAEKTKDKTTIITVFKTSKVKKYL